LEQTGKVGQRCGKGYWQPLNRNVSLWWLTLLELCLGAWLWSSGHDNIGMIVIIMPYFMGQLVL